MELASLSPSAGNLQARSMVIVRDRKMKERIAEVARGQHSIIEAPMVCVICAHLEESAHEYGKRGRELYSIQDATIFTAYLQLTITALGLASCWIGAFDEMELKQILDLSDEIRPIAIIPTGLAVEDPHITGRKSLTEIIEKEI